jgi:hypothetical protein
MFEALPTVDVDLIRAVPRLPVDMLVAKAKDLKI